MGEREGFWVETATDGQPPSLSLSAMSHRVATDQTEEELQESPEDPGLEGKAEEREKR